MHDQHFEAKPIPNGHTWTLPSRLGAMLLKAEADFGPRDKTYTILGVEIGVSIPRIWYPGNCGNIIVQLGSKALDDPYLAHYQLAHECVHLLAPTGSFGTTVLEEGLATVFSEDWVGTNAAGMSPTDAANYVEAAGWTRLALSQYPTFVRDVRKIEPAFTKMTAAQLKAVMPNIPSIPVDRLLLPFPY